MPRPGGCWSERSGTSQFVWSTERSVDAGRRSGVGGTFPKGRRGDVRFAVGSSERVERFEDSGGSDLLCPLKRAFGIIGSELHRLVYVFCGSHAFGEGEEGL